MVAWHKPKDIAPLIFKAPKRKKWKVSLAMNEDAWIKVIDMSKGLSRNHVRKFVELWSHLAQVSLNEDVDDSIHWKFSTNREYFGGGIQGLILGSYPHSNEQRHLESVGSPKGLFFWLAIQNRV